MKLAISLATRGRPQQLVDTIGKSIVNWRHPETVMQVQLDDDDPASYEALKKANFGERVILNVQPREDTIAEKWNRALALDADVYSIAADDDPYVTPGYDAKILEAATVFPDGIGMVYGALANLSFTSSLSMTKRMANILGYIQPTHFPYWFCDHWTDDLAKMIGRISYADIRTDQSRAGATQEFREPGWWATFFDVCYLIRRQEAHRLLSQFAIDSDLSLLQGQWPLIDQRSRMINSGVRGMKSNLSLDLKAPRYLRVREKAEALAAQAMLDPAFPVEMKQSYGSYLFPPKEVPSLQRAYG